MKEEISCKTIEILNLSDKELIEISKKNVLSLSLEEMKVLQNHFKKQKRNPTDVELETIAQTWSEHCKHKTLTGIIEYNEIKNGKITKKIYKNLLKETIFKATAELNKKWCWSVFKDNAGIIEFDKKFGAAFKVETHNHPSALEPYGGSATGIGGVIRDILGVGLGAKPLANTDVFCFGSPNTSPKKIPEGMHHPKRIAKGVISGVRDYGNRMGIPTVNGAVFFDDGYIANPLVYCGTMGIIPKSKITKDVKPKDLVLVVGGKTGRDGIHGATFSSVQLDKESDVNAVQIGNPIVEKKVLDVMLKARDLKLYRAVTDCGAGGLSSAVGELGENTGVKVELEKVQLKYAGLLPWEIWISEAQERMVFAVPVKNKNRILELFKKENVDAVFVGEFTNDRKLTLTYNKKIVADMSMDFLHNGIPKPKRLAVYKNSTERKQKPVKMNSEQILKSLKSVLSDLNVCSKEWIIRQYDHEVQGQTIIKPLQGNSIEVSGPGDAAVIFPFVVVKNTKKSIVLSNGLNPKYGKIDTYKMAANAIEEALRNAVAVGGNIERMSALDNFCWGNPNNPKILGSLVRAAKACYDMSKAFGVPFISGKDSLHNEYCIGGEKYSIPPALLISVIGIIENVENTVTMPFKEEGNKVFVLGLTRNELGGSVFSDIENIKDGIVPDVFPKESLKIMKDMHKAINRKLVESCHDISDGGLSAAISEMSFSGQKGVFVNIDAIRTDEKLTPAEKLFSQSSGRFIIEVKPKNVSKIEKIFKGCAISDIGYIEGSEVVFESKKNKLLVKEYHEVLMRIWQKPLLPMDNNW
ncbi:MAG: phosphoribosylformylglycinamidine synthase subunit PurL [Elusimicrobiota bacterium]|jgi:phosphoribosylformylglycinamidine synthase|nr:phosphoribosylformylglycinamidine synthase subunit PurL [Elusimicrobiota bacterium]